VTTAAPVTPAGPVTPQAVPSGSPQSYTSGAAANTPAAKVVPYYAPNTLR
jgi:hypothetical protein